MSSSEIATTPASTRYSWILAVARQEDATLEASRTTKPATLGTFRFEVLVGHAVVADVGNRHYDDLLGVGRVGQDLLVAAVGRVEYDLSRGSAGRPERHPFENATVLECEDGTRVGSEICACRGQGMAPNLDGGQNR